MAFDVLGSVGLAIGMLGTLGCAGPRVCQVTHAFGDVSNHREVLHFAEDGRLVRVDSHDGRGGAGRMRHGFDRSGRLRLTRAWFRSDGFVTPHGSDHETSPERRRTVRRYRYDDEERLVEVVERDRSREARRATGRPTGRIERNLRTTTFEYRHGLEVNERTNDYEHVTRWYLFHAFTPGLTSFRERSNRTTPTTMFFRYDTDHRLVSIEADYAGGSKVVEYDQNGRWRSDGAEYDAKGRLVALGAGSFEYDEKGRLAAEVRGGRRETFSYEGRCPASSVRSLTPTVTDRLDPFQRPRAWPPAEPWPPAWYDPERGT